MSTPDPRLSKPAVLIVFLFGILVTCSARADHYRAGDLERLMATPNWELVRQEVNAVTGDYFGAPVLVHRYATLAECDRAQRGRISKPHDIGTTHVVGQFVCRHKDADAV